MLRSAVVQSAIAPVPTSSQVLVEKVASRAVGNLPASQVMHSPPAVVLLAVVQPVKVVAVSAQVFCPTLVVVLKVVG